MQMFVWDTETTGINCQVDRLVELAAIVVNSRGELVRTSGGFTRRFETYVNPKRDIPPEAKCVHHITEHMVFGAPAEDEAVGNMLRHLDASPGDLFIAHNARFDRGFMRRIAADVEMSFKHSCTMKCAKVIWPDAPSYSNQFLRYWLNLNPELPEGLAPHRALYDIIVTAAIFEEELKHMPLEEMISISNAPLLLKKMPMGKHKGMPFDQVPISYLKWILDQQPSDMDPDLVYTAQVYFSKTRSFR